MPVIFDVLIQFEINIKANEKNTYYYIIESDFLSYCEYEMFPNSMY